MMAFFINSFYTTKRDFSSFLNFFCIGSYDKLLQECYTADTRLKNGGGIKKSFEHLLCRMKPRLATKGGGMLTRRDFIKFLGITGAISLTPLRRILHFNSQVEDSIQQDQIGELYADFLLLPEGAAVPNFVQYSKAPMPRLCGVGIENKEARPDAVVHFFETHEEMAHKIDFPIYYLSPLPDDLRQGKAFSLSFDNGELHSLSMGYEAFNKETQYWENIVSFWMFKQFPRPFPLWIEDPVEVGGPSVFYEKVDFLPAPGIKVRTQEGFVFYWVEKDVLCTLTLEPCATEIRSQEYINLISLF